MLRSKEVQKITVPTLGDIIQLDSDCSMKNGYSIEIKHTISIQTYAKAITYEVGFNYILFVNKKSSFKSNLASTVNLQQFTQRLKYLTKYCVKIKPIYLSAGIGNQLGHVKLICRQYCPQM